MEMSREKGTRIIYDCTDLWKRKDAVIEKHSFFAEEWNPLTGDLPIITEQLYPESSGCLDIIIKCRDLWTGWRPSEGPKTRKEHARFAKEIMTLWKLVVRKDGSYTAGMHRKSISEQKMSFPVTSFALECHSVLAIMLAREALRKRFVKGCLECDESFQFIIKEAETHYLTAAERDRQAGMKVHRGQAHSGQSRSRQIYEERSPIWDKWQGFADEIWDKNRRLSKVEVARRCSRNFAGTEYEGSMEAIRKRIEKPSK